MKKKTLIALSVSLGLISPILGANKVHAASVDPSHTRLTTEITSPPQEQLQLTKDQLQVKDSDIDSWMPNKSLQAEMLRVLIYYGYLPEGSTVNQITKELLESLDSSADFFLAISTFQGAKITNNVSEGLQYVNPAADITLALVDADESQLMNVDLVSLHNNVDTWYFEIYNTEQIEHPQLMKKIIDAKLPAKDSVLTPQVTYTRGTYTDDGDTFVPSVLKNIDISQTYFPSITLSDNDFWHEIDKTQYSSHVLFDSLSKANGVPMLHSLFDFEPVSEISYQGTISPTSTNTAIMYQVYNNPQAYLDRLTDIYTYDDNEHQPVDVSSTFYANFVK